MKQYQQKNVVIFWRNLNQGTCMRDNSLFYYEGAELLLPFSQKLSVMTHDMVSVLSVFPSLYWSFLQWRNQMDHRWKWNYFLSFIFFFFQNYSWALSQLLWWNNRHGFRHRLIILLSHSYKYCLKKEQECIRFINSRQSGEFLHLIIYDCGFFNSFKTSDIDQLILALIFRFGVILV